MPDARGRFIKGEHWREPQPFREREWLEREYVEKQRSMADIGEEFGVTSAAVRFWVRRHGIQSRSISQARAVKHWGADGEKNPMFGKRGAEVPNWKGGVTPERQAFYSSLEWAKAAQFVWDRDEGKCQRCAESRTEKRSMHIHHIAPFSVRELRAVPSNLVLLCNTCHRWVHSRNNTGRLFLSG